MLRRLPVCLLLCAALAFSDVSGTSQDQPSEEAFDLSDLEFLLGVWVHPGGDQIACEAWQKVSDHTFEGRGFQVKDGDTVTTEVLRLVKMGEGVYFISMVAHNLRPVSFRLVQLDGTVAVFENLEHDFPQRIVYSLEGDQLTGRIEGEKDGKMRRVEFPFVRVNKP
jgi:hypothetical protein